MTASAAARAFLRPGHVQFVRQRFHPVIGHRNGRGIERVGFDDVRAGLEILAMDFLDDVRPGQTEQIVVAFDIARPILEPFAAIRRLVEAIGLDHGAHRAVEDDDALAQQAQQRVHSFRSIDSSPSPIGKRDNTAYGVLLQVKNQYILI